MDEIKPGKLDTYICWKCKETYIRGWSDQEAMEEYKRNFPGKPISESETLCENCFQDFKIWAISNGIKVE